MILGLPPQCSASVASRSASRLASVTSHSASSASRSVSGASRSVSITATSWSVTPTSTPKSTGGSKITKSAKVTESDFTPRTHHLAVASKSHVRTTIIYNSFGPFPPANKLGHLEFLWNTVKETATNSEDETIKKAFRQVKADEKIKKNLITFVSNLFNAW